MAAVEHAAEIQATTGLEKIVSEAPQKSAEKSR